MEKIDPSVFNDGVKLLEISYGSGTNKILPLLLADGNGRGGGDVAYTTCRAEYYEGAITKYVKKFPFPSYKDVTKLPLKEVKAVADVCGLKTANKRKAQLIDEIEKNNCETDPIKVAKEIAKKKNVAIANHFIIKDKKGNESICYTFAPKFVGRWAGDKIVVSGNYADEGRFANDIKINNEHVEAVMKLTKNPLSPVFKKLSSKLSTITDENKRKEVVKKSLNLWELDYIGAFRDISKDIVKQVKHDPILSDIFKEK